MPACEKLIGDQAFQFGIQEDEGGLITQSTSITLKRDKKEGRNGCGEVKAVAMYNQMQEVTIEGLGRSDAGVGDVLAFIGDLGIAALSANMSIDEVTVTRSNEDFIKTSIKASAYEKI